MNKNDSNEIRTHNHLVRKRTLNHLAKLAKLLGCVVSTYLHGVFICTICTFCTDICTICAFGIYLYYLYLFVLYKCTAQITTHNTAQSFGQFG